MSTDKETEHESNIRAWFPEPLSDETICAIHLFLQQFTQQFEADYGIEINRYLDKLGTAENEHSTGIPWNDDIDF